MIVTDKMLEENTIPFGLLTEEMQNAFKNLPYTEMLCFLCHGWEPKRVTGIDSFITYRKKPTPKVGLNIPWNHLHEKWKYAAMDEDGKVYLYIIPPKQYAFNWCDCHTYRELCGNIFDFSYVTVDWKDSLVERPQVSK